MLIVRVFVQQPFFPVLVFQQIYKARSCAAYLKCGSRIEGTVNSVGLGASSGIYQWRGWENDLPRLPEVGGVTLLVKTLNILFQF